MTKSDATYLCPICSGSKWKAVQENVVRKFKQCTNCGFNPLAGAEERATSKDARDFIKDLAGIRAEKLIALQETEYEYTTGKDSPDAVILSAKVQRAKRAFELVERRLLALSAMIEVVGLAPAEGMVTIHLPELALIYQFTWGDYDLLKGVSREG